MLQSNDSPSTSAPHHRLSESELLEAWQRGDLRAGAELTSRQYGDLLHFFARRIGERDSEDLAQATMLACLESLENFRWEASVRGLLFGIARYKLAHYHYARRRANRRVGPELQPYEPPSPSAALQELDEYRHLHSALARLPADKRTILEAHYWDSVKLKDIAANQGLRLNTLKTQMRRIRQQIAEEID